jgi:hypothetical protein
MRIAMRLAIVLLLLCWPELAKATLEHIGIGLLCAWLGYQHGHSPPRRH